jgi:hypothetical protein
MDRRHFLNLIAAFGVTVCRPGLPQASLELPPWAGIFAAARDGYWRLVGLEYYFGMNAPLLWLNNVRPVASLKADEVVALRFLNDLQRSLDITDETLHEFETVNVMSQIPENLFRPVAKYYQNLILAYGAASLSDPRTGYFPDKLMERNSGLGPI